MEIEKLLTWIESEIKKADANLSQVETFPDLSYNFARLRYLKHSKEVINEYLKTSKWV